LRSRFTILDLLVYPVCTFRAIPRGRGEEDLMYVRAVLCDCRRRLEAEDDRNLRVLVREHLTAEHATVPPTSEGLVEEIVSTRAYDLEHAAAYAGADGAEEDFGPEPY
jgi:hypothetical protein